MASKTMHVCLLPQDIQDYILKTLQSQDLSEEDIQNAMDSRVCDLEDTFGLKIIRFK